ncbi:MAG: hypothetical protein J5716_03250 [Alphaproteobacteria bacterium]|nr:hypothetical protein [Alphaproteobacteria bacterium]
MKRLLFVLFVVMLVFPSSYAEGKKTKTSCPFRKKTVILHPIDKEEVRIKPELSVEVDEGTPKFIHKRPQFPCSNGINHGGGCTRVEFYAVIKGAKMTPEGAFEKLQLKIGIKNIVVELSSELQKGTCLFDVVLKHELTHLALHRNVLKRFAPEIAKAVLSTAESFQTKQAERIISEVLKDYTRRMSEEDDRQNALMDTTDSYIYQQKQCFQSKKTRK